MKVEYKKVEIDIEDPALATLNQYGAEGWRLKSIVGKMSQGLAGVQVQQFAILEREVLQSEPDICT